MEGTPLAHARNPSSSREMGGDGGDGGDGGYGGYGESPPAHVLNWGVGDHQKDDADNGMTDVDFLIESLELDPNPQPI